MKERQFNPLAIPLITFEKFHNNGPKISNPPGDPEIRKIKLFTPEKNISILVMQKQVFVVGTSNTRRLSFPVSQRNSIGLEITQFGVKTWD